MQRKRLWLMALVGLMGGNILCANGEEWPQVFSDDFNRSDIFGPEWVVKSGNWDMRGALRANGPNALIMCTRRFQVPFRIEYECSSDNPCDLSVQFNSKLDDKIVCSVGFGSMFNTKNKILTAVDGEVAASTENLIEIGRRHRVMVEVTETGIRQVIDGKESVKANVIFPQKGVYFGFYVWNAGTFSSVKVYSPNAMTTGKAETRNVELSAENPVREFKSFEDWPLGTIAGTNVMVRCGEKGLVKIADVPTWLYYNVKSKYRNYQENEDPAKVDAMMKGATNKGCRFVSDRCVELASEPDAGKGKAEIAFPMPAMRNGLVEFDIMADQYSGEALRIRLGDKLGLLVDKDGMFSWEAGGQTVKLAQKIYYPDGPARFYLQPQRWFTVRIDFDTSLSLANVAIVNLFGFFQPGSVGQFFPVGEDLPLPTDTVANITFETAGAGRFYIDNLFFINRTSDLADDAKWRVSAREILKAYYHLRKDPLSLKMYSQRNVRNQYGSGTPTGDELQDLRKSPEKYPVILGNARQYNRILIEQAFLAETMRGLERAYFYLNIKSEELAGKHNGQIIQAQKNVTETEALLAQLYRFYADCYLDNLNQVKMKEGFASRHDALKSAIEKSSAFIQKTYEDMAGETSGKSSALACRYERHVNPEPFSFSKGSFRRNGKRDYLFVSKNSLMWPYMEKDLLFCDILPLGSGHLATKALEPNYCDNSANTYFHECLTSLPTNFMMALSVSSGLHYHESTLPTWWFEKHKADRDIFLQNCKGDIGVGQSGSASVNKSYNYWNPEVMTAQKGYLEGIVDVLAGYNKDLLKRVAYIDMAQEALFQIEASGGLWETGYNKTAIKAFQEELNKKYGNIGVLNERWGSKYGSFDEIQPPDDFCLKPRMVPSGLGYEFERFRMQSWSDWLKQSQQWIKAKLPDKNTPSSCDISGQGGQDSIDGLDFVRLFETFDIVMEHAGYSLSTYRALENLRQAFNTTTGIGEWGAGMIAGGDPFDEQDCLNAGLCYAYRQIQWGRSVLVIWLGHESGCTGTGNWTEGRLGHTVFRYDATYIPLSIARARAHQAIYLECPLVEPDVGVIESETSFYNTTGVRGGMYEFTQLLISKGHDYGFLYERLIMDGRQKLDNYKVLILPNALALPEAFMQKLMAWVEKGGILLATGPAGAWNEYGQTNGLILDKVIGRGNWTSQGRIFKLKDKMTDTGTCKIAYRKDASFLVEGQVGQGKVYIRQGLVSNDMLYGLISDNAPRLFYAEGNKFSIVMRKGNVEQDNKWFKRGGENLYLSVLNPDCYQTLEDEIVLKGEYRDVSDISCNFPITPSIKDGYTRFKVKLAPAEGVMIRIKK